MRLSIALFTLVLTTQSLVIPAIAQQDPIVDAIIKEANGNSQLKRMSHELMDGVGPRLVGSTKMMQASDWAIAQYQQYGITARSENYGTWRGWDRGITHVDMISPWTKSLEANNKVKLNENLVVVFKEPTVKTLAKYPDYKETTEQLYGFMGSCIKQIQNQKESIDCSDMSEKEITEFIENLTSIQFKSIINYFDSLPQIEIVTNYETSDGIKREIKIKGLFDYINFFFSHLNLQLFYTQNFQMKYQHNYSLEEIENMIPFERAVYVEQVRAHLNKEKQRLSQNIGATPNG